MYLQILCGFINDAMIQSFIVNLLLTECENKSYGENCGMVCGKCKDNESCNHKDGTCPNGCSDGWTGNKCTDS